MVSISPEQASFLLQYTLPTLKNEHRITRSVIEAIPQSQSDYRPDPNSKTAMELAWHVVAAEHRFYGGIVAGAFDFTPIHRPEIVRTPVEIAQWYDDSFARNFDAFPNLSGDSSPKSSISVACSSFPRWLTLPSPCITPFITAASSPLICAPWAEKFRQSMGKATIQRQRKQPHRPRVGRAYRTSTSCLLGQPPELLEAIQRLARARNHLDSFRLTSQPLLQIYRTRV